MKEPSHSHRKTPPSRPSVEMATWRKYVDTQVFSFLELARELDFTEEQIHQIRIENPNSLQDQSHALLKYWLDRDGKHATGKELSATGREKSGSLNPFFPIDLEATLHLLTSLATKCFP